MVDILHRIGIKSPVVQVYKALSTLEGLSNWWTEEVEGDEQIGGKIEFTTGLGIRQIQDGFRSHVGFEYHILMSPITLHRLVKITLYLDVNKVDLLPLQLGNIALDAGCDQACQREQ